MATSNYLESMKFSRNSQKLTSKSLQLRTGLVSPIWKYSIRSRRSCLFYTESFDRVLELSMQMAFYLQIVLVSLANYLWYIAKTFVNFATRF